MILTLNIQAKVRFINVTRTSLCQEHFLWRAIVHARKLATVRDFQSAHTQLLFAPKQICVFAGVRKRDRTRLKTKDCLEHTWNSRLPTML